MPGNLPFSRLQGARRGTPGRSRGRHPAAPATAGRRRPAGSGFAYRAKRARAGTNEAAFTVPHPVALL